VRMNAPLRVPTSTRTLLIPHSFESETTSRHNPALVAACLLSDGRVISWDEVQGLH